MTTKKCYICKEEKDLNKFHKDIRSLDGYRSYCRKCKAVRNKQSHLRFIEKRKYFTEEEHMIWWIRNNIHRAEPKFKERKNLSISYLLEKAKRAKELFPYIIFDGSGESALWASLDRIENDKGYVEGNIQIVPLWYNSAKLRLTNERIIELMRDFLNKYDSLQERINK